MPGNPGGGTSGGGGGGVTDHGALTGLADDDHTQYSLIATGAGAPATTPGREGLIYVDTDADTVYVSTDTASSADWTLLDADGHTHVLADITDSGALAALSTVGTSEIDDEAVTVAKLQHISEDKILGRNTAGTGDVQVLTKVETLALLNVEDGADVTDLTNIRAALAATTAAQSATADTFPYVDADGTMQRATAAEIVTQGNDDLSIVPQNRVSTTVDPDANDDTNSGYLVNDLWTNTSTDITFICVDNTALSAIWTPITGATSAAGTPASAPDFVGQIYIDTTSEDVYVAVDTAAASDFVLLDQDGHTHVLADITDSGALAALATVGTSEIDDEAVTNAKLAHVATDTIKGRTTAGTGDVEDMTPAQVRTMLNVADGAEVNAVDSVNTQTGAVVLDADDISDAATTNKFTTAAEISKLAGIEASATANPRSATSIFEATLSSATQNCNGTQGSTFDFTWTTSVNNGTYIDTFVNGDSIISFVEAGEYVVDTAIIVLNSAMTGRLIFTGQIRHENSSAVEQYTHTLAASYIRDTNASYDSGGVAGQVTVFAAAGDQIKIRRVVLDTASSGSNVYADQTETKVRIQKID